MYCGERQGRVNTPRGGPKVISSMSIWPLMPLPAPLSSTGMLAVPCAAKADTVIQIITLFIFTLCLC